MRKPLAVFAGILAALGLTATMAAATPAAAAVRSTASATTAQSLRATWTCTVDGGTFAFTLDYDSSGNGYSPTQFTDSGPGGYTVEGQNSIDTSVGYAYTLSGGSYVDIRNMIEVGTWDGGYPNAVAVRIYGPAGVSQINAYVRLGYYSYRLASGHYCAIHAAV